MKLLQSPERAALLLATFAVLGVAGAVVARGMNTSSPQATVSRATAYTASFSPDGALVRPIDYRRWIYVGVPLTPNDMNDGAAAFPEFHSVYIHPAAYDHYEKTGEFSDGTTIIKELVSVGSKQAPSGNGYFMGEFVGLEAAVKDSTRFKDEPGNWAFFSFGHDYPLQGEAELQPRAACNECHGSLAADDFVFTQYYPVLRDAKSMSASSHGRD